MSNLSANRVTPYNYDLSVLSNQVTPHNYEQYIRLSFSALHGPRYQNIGTSWIQFILLL
jgi:hypothetical protein